MNSPGSLEKDTYLHYLAGFVFAAAIIFYLHLSGTYLDFSHQIVIGWGTLVLLIILQRVELFKEQPWRTIFILIASFITLRYWFWRTFETLVYTGPLDFIGMMVLYLAESYAITVHLLGAFINIWPMDRKIIPLSQNQADIPTVDVFIPTYNEPEDVVRITVAAATQIDYPSDKFRIYLLDDGGTVAKRNDPETASEAWERYSSFKRMAGEFGVHYITRETNSHAKAGNINHALRHSNGELILFLDCDHVPTRDILKNTVGQFRKDRKLFLVQTPHFFINPDPVEKNLATFTEAPSESEMFFCSIHPGLDFWNASYFCGSAAVMRRKLLEEVGGVSVETITEDAETAFILHGKGYNSAYINRPMVCGLSPETFDDFIAQRVRWAQGMLQIFILKKPELTKGLKLYQRLCYTNSSIFWFFGFSRFVFYVAPAAFLILGLKVYNASVLQVLGYAIPHVLCGIVLMNYLYGKYRWPLFSELYESVQSIFMIHPVASAILNPRAPTFKVTPKGEGAKVDFLSHFAGPFYAMFLIALAGIPVAIYKWFHLPLFRDVIIITLCWTIFNVLMALASLGAFWERKQLRHYHRIVSRDRVRLYSPRLNKTVEGKIDDISLTGISVEFSESFHLHNEEDVWIEAKDSYGEEYRFKARIHRLVKNEDITLCGCEFEMNRETYKKVVRFVYGDSQRWVDFWAEKSKPAGPLHILFYFMRMGIKGGRESFRGLYQLILVNMRRGYYRVVERMNNFRRLKRT